MHAGSGFSKNVIEPAVARDIIVISIVKLLRSVLVRKRGTAPDFFRSSFPKSFGLGLLASDSQLKRKMRHEKTGSKKLRRWPVMEPSCEGSAR